MKDKIEALKAAMDGVSEDRLHAAFDHLEKELNDLGDYPGSAQIEKAIEDTVSELNSDAEDEGIIEEIWDKLRSEIEDFSLEHPTITKVVGDIARALSSSGI